MQGPLAEPALPDAEPGPACEPSGADSKQAELDFFYMFSLKVAPCQLRSVHDWSACPFAHEGERIRRRDPRTSQYTGIACLAMKQRGRCTMGDSCPYAHSAWEYWLHPTRYKTSICSQGEACRRTFCFFAHKPQEIRVPEERPGLPPAMAAAMALRHSTAAAAAGRGGGTGGRGHRGKLQPSPAAALAAEPQLAVLRQGSPVATVGGGQQAWPGLGSSSDLDSVHEGGAAGWLSRDGSVEQPLASRAVGHGAAGPSGEGALPLLGAGGCGAAALGSQHTVAANPWQPHSAPPIAAGPSLAIYGAPLSPSPTDPPLGLPAPVVFEPDGALPAGWEAGSSILQGCGITHGVMNAVANEVALGKVDATQAAALLGTLPPTSWEAQQRWQQAQQRGQQQGVQRLEPNSWLPMEVGLPTQQRSPLAQGLAGRASPPQQWQQGSGVHWLPAQAAPVQPRGVLAPWQQQAPLVEQLVQQQQVQQVQHQAFLTPHAYNVGSQQQQQVQQQAFLTPHAHNVGSSSSTGAGGIA